MTNLENRILILWRQRKTVSEIVTIINREYDMSYTEIDIRKIMQRIP